MKIIAIEGVDCSGKSSLCNRLRAKLPEDRVAVVKTPASLFTPLCSLSIQAGTVASFNAFLLSSLSLMKSYASYDWLILDRYLLSTLVYHYDVVQELGNNCQELLKGLPLKTPELTCYLEAEDELVQARLETRNDFSRHNQKTADLKERYSDILNNGSWESVTGKLLRVPSNIEKDQDDNLDKLLSVIYK